MQLFRPTQLGALLEAWKILVNWYMRLKGAKLVSKKIDIGTKQLLRLEKINELLFNLNG